jgi:tetratricopeptide (TPR) repeat protein
MLFYFPLSAQQDEISIKAANTYYNRFMLQESRTMFKSITESSSFPATDRVEAMQNLALQDWKIFRNYPAAEKGLNEALVFPVQRTKSWVLLGQISLEANQFQKAYGCAEQAIHESRNKTDSINSFLLAAQIIHDENIQLLKTGAQPDKEKLLKASFMLRYILSNQPGTPVPAELWLGVSLILKNGPDAFAAWKSYFFIAGEKTVNRILIPAYGSLKMILPQWNAGNLSETDRISLVKGLASSRFYDYASLVATSTWFGKPFSARFQQDNGILPVLQFEKYIEAVKRVDDSFYPKIAAGWKNYDSAYEKAIAETSKALWIELGKNNTIDNYNEDDFFTQIKQEFGAEGYIGTTVGYLSMLLGLIVHDEIKEINQYGYKANFRYESISRLISKDFTSWYGATNVGGWGTDSAIMQVRDAYLQDPFTRLEWVTDTNACRKMEDQIAAAKAKDWIRCAKDPYAEPSFLAPHIKLQASKQLFDSLQRAGLTGNALYLAFISETMRLNVESTVFAHEGRHAIDQLYFKAEFDAMTQDERELRAKFSEVIFSSNAKLALTGSIFGSDLDSTTIHGKANLRFRKIMVSWMQSHSQEINNLDVTAPLMMQVDLLTQQQIREICLSADPLASQEGKR